MERGVRLFKSFRTIFSFLYKVCLFVLFIKFLHSLAVTFVDESDKKFSKFCTPNLNHLPARIKPNINVIEKVDQQLFANRYDSEEAV